MGLLDIGAAVFDTAERAMARPASARPVTTAPQIIKRHYQAAQDNRLTAGMANAPLSADAVTARTRRKLVARSRQESDINDYCKRFLTLQDTNIVGPAGIALRAQFLNTDESLDESANRTVEDRWARWGRRGSCDITGTLSWLDVQSQVLKSAAVDGEALVRHIVGPMAGPCQYALQVLDSELLSVDDNRDLRNGNQVRMGIEYNKLDQPVAYWLLDPDRTPGVLSSGYHGRTVRRVPAEQITHIFQADRPGQHRGLPWTSTSLLRLAILEGMEDAALVAARVGASKVAWFKKTKGSTGYTGDGKGPDGEIYLDAEPGSFGELDEKTSIEKWDPAYPNGEFGPFIKAVLRGISAGLGVPYTSLSNDLEGVNYSSIRAGTIEARDLYRRQQNWLISSLMAPVYERWLQVQLLNGGLVLPSGNALPPHKIEKYKRVAWHARSWEWVDPLKEAQSHELFITRGTMTESESIRARGREPEDVWQERKRELDRKKKIGLPAGPVEAQLVPIVADPEEPDPKPEGPKGADA